MEIAEQNSAAFPSPAKAQKGGRNAVSVVRRLLRRLLGRAPSPCAIPPIGSTFTVLTADASNCFCDCVMLPSAYLIFATCSIGSRPTITPLSRPARGGAELPTIGWPLTSRVGVQRSGEEQAGENERSSAMMGVLRPCASMRSMLRRALPAQRPDNVPVPCDPRPERIDCCNCSGVSADSFLAASGILNARGPRPHVRIALLIFRY